jgi:acetate---CoA ligase (ADP-forming)
VTTAQRRKTLSSLREGGRVIGEYDSKLILKSYGVPRPNEHLVRDEAAAMRVASEIGGAVALKIQARGLAHKTESGGVALSLATQEAVSTAYRAITDRICAQHPDLAIEGMLVQPMATPGVEMVVGITRDAQFGPMLMAGLGGIHVEVLKDVAFAPVPIQPAEARRLLESLRGYKLLEGARGAPAADIDALTALMSALSRFATDFADEIAEIDVNPVIVHPAGEGLTVVDALIVRQAADDC